MKRLYMCAVVVTTLLFVVSLVGYRHVEACRDIDNHSIGSHYVTCPSDPCTVFTIGFPCNYCDGTGTANMPNTGGENCATIDNTFDCGDWWNGTCSWFSGCQNATRGAPCMQDESSGC